jgi:hypothetical protein
MDISPSEMEGAEGNWVLQHYEGWSDVYRSTFRYSGCVSKGKSDLTCESRFLYDATSFGDR